jgi:hypothetical protein
MNPIIIDKKHPGDARWFPLNQAQFDDLRLADAVDARLGFNYDHMEITGGELPEYISGIYLTGNAGTFFGVRPLLGRNMEPSDAEKGGRSVVVLNYRFWQRHFGGDPHTSRRLPISTRRKCGGCWRTPSFRARGSMPLTKP